MRNDIQLYEHQLKAIQHVQENGLEVGRTNVLCSLVGRSQLSGKTNMLQHYLHSLPKEEREKFLANVRIVSPMADFESRERMEEVMRHAEERMHASMHVLVSSDVHIAAVSGGGRSTPVIEDYARYYATPKHLVICAERPNTTDMFRMFRDNRNKPKRGKK